MRAFWVLLAFSSLGLAQPYINYRGIVNVASYMAPGLPAGSLPQGGMFAIFGSNLGPAAGVSAPGYPLSTTLSGVSITVTQQSTAVNAYPVYVGAGQINAIMPSNTPLGRVSVRVTVNNVASNPSPANVVSSSFGIITVNGAGFGPGIIQNYTTTALPVNSTQATATPGQAEILWGAGLGPVPVAQDNTNPVQVNLPVQVEVFVGGQAASVFYSGRSLYAGIDQINFYVPDAAPAGCYVPVAVRLAGTVVSNTATMAIDPKGAPCTDAANPLSAIFRAGGRFGAALLRHEDDQMTVDGAAQSFSVDSAALSLRQEAGGAWAFNPYVSFPPVGTCTAYGIAGLFPTTSDLPGIAATVKDLNGGASVSLTGPSGTANLPQSTASPVVYAGVATSQNLTGVPLSFFVNGMSNTLAGTGGADVGAFTANITASAEPAWTNSANVATVTRSAGFTVTWSNAPAGANVVSIIGFNVDPANNISGGFQCLASPAAGSFTVPALALANVPATPAGLAVVRGWISVGAAPLSSPVSFTASGLDKGIAIFGSSSQQTVVFQ